MTLDKTIRLIGMIAVLMLFSSCMTAAKQSKALFSEPLPKDLLNKTVIANVPFIQQQSAECGPAAVAMVLQYYNHPISMEQISQKILSRKNHGTLPTDMIMASRSEGFMAVPIRGLVPLLREVQIGHPVIVFENLGVSWWNQWHYAVIVGFDLEQQTLLMHSGTESLKVEKIDVFELSWSLAEYWGLVIVPSGQLPVTGNEVDDVTATVALENMGFFDQAELSYQAILDRWPQSYVSLLGLGQMAFRKNNFRAALDLFQRAVNMNPKSEVAQTNFKIVQKQLQKKN